MPLHNPIGVLSVIPLNRGTYHLMSNMLVDLHHLVSFRLSGMKNDLPHFLNAFAQLYRGNICYPPQPGDISFGYHCCWQNYLLWGPFDFLVWKVICHISFMPLHSPTELISVIHLNRGTYQLMSNLLVDLHPLVSFWLSGMKSDLLHFLDACAQPDRCNISYPPQQGVISFDVTYAGGFTSSGVISTF